MDGSKDVLMVRFGLALPVPKMPPHTTGYIFGGPIHAPLENQQA